MWFLIGRFRCLACDGLKGVGDRSRRSPYRRSFGVCRTCYDTWERSGRKCARCKGEVKGSQEVAVFTEQKSFAHYDCGGTRLV